MTRRSSKTIAGLACCVGGLALLIWTKMKIVGDVPRTAYAEPAGKDQPDPQPQPTADSSPRDENDPARDERALSRH